MIIATLGIVCTTMVGPLDDGRAVRISRPGGGPPEVIRQVVGELTTSRGVDVPSNSVAGGGTITVVGAQAAADDLAAASTYDEPLGLYTEQLLRAFGYDRGNFGYAYVNSPQGGWGGAHGGGRGGHGWRGDPPRETVDPRVTAALRDLMPLESRYQPVPGR